MATAPHPAALNQQAAALTDRGHFYLQLARVRDSFERLSPDDQRWALEAIASLLRTTVRLEQDVR
jgi:hypothetical protein